MESSMSVLQPCHAGLRSLSITDTLSSSNSSDDDDDWSGKCNGCMSCASCCLEVPHTSHANRSYLLVKVQAAQAHSSFSFCTSSVGVELMATIGLLHIVHTFVPTLFSNVHAGQLTNESTSSSLSSSDIQV